MPARRNAANCREKFMRSTGLSFLVVISIWLSRLRSLTCTLRNSRLESSLRTRTALAALITPLTFTPVGSVATYLNFGTGALPARRR